VSVTVVVVVLVRLFTLVDHRCLNRFVVGFSKAAAKVAGHAGDQSIGLIHPLSATEVNPRVGLLVEAEDLHGG
jgi:hypothetical protein